MQTIHKIMELQNEMLPTKMPHHKAKGVFSYGNSFNNYKTSDFEGFCCRISNFICHYILV